MNFFPDTHTPYIIYAPGWTYKSAGVRALHLLCHALNESGEKAYLLLTTPGAANPELNTPLLSEFIADWYGFLESGIDFIAVYPDVVVGNPLNAKRVVRWLLAPAGKYGGDKEFSTTDKVYGYVKGVAEPVLCLPTFDLRIFRPYSFSKIARKGDVYYAHKYHDIFGNKLLDVTKDARELKGMPFEIAEMLRGAERCYLYECTEVEVLARMCGCEPVAVITDFWDGKRPEEFEDAPSAFGATSDGNLVAWGKRFDEQLRVFIKDTQQCWEVS